jgi:hypothetical protein
LAALGRDSERRVGELRALKEKERLEMEKKYETRFKELQAYYEKLLEEKVQESERVAYDAAERIKEEEDEVRKYLMFVEENSTPNDEYNRLAKYCEGVKQIL